MILLFVGILSTTYYIFATAVLLVMDAVLNPATSLSFDLKKKKKGEGLELLRNNTS